MSIRKVIIIGGAGFLGSRIAFELNKTEKFKICYGDINKNPILDNKYFPINTLEPNSLKVLNDFDIIINCTGQNTLPFNLCFRLNSEGIQNLINQVVNRSCRFIQISTTAVYGSGKSCNEISPLNPETNYAAMKAGAEVLLNSNLKSSKLTILRLSNLYGPNQKKGLIAYLLRSYSSDRSLSFNNDGNLVRSFLHVYDAAKITSLCAINSNVKGVYNIKGPDTFSINKLLNLFENEFNVIFEKKFSNNDPWENIDNLDDSKIKKELNFQYSHSLFSFFKDKLESLNEN